MSKSLGFFVTVTFESKITLDEDILEVANNIARAIVSETNGIGISPQSGDTFLEYVEVKPQYLDETVSLNAY